MMKFFKRFAQDESGAVTVDWVVLTAAVVGLAIAVVAAVNTSVAGIAEDIGEEMAAELGGGNFTEADD